MKKTIVIESLNKNLLMGFNSNSLSISDIKGSGLKFSSSAEQKIIVRTSDAVFEPHLLSKVKKNTVSIDEIKFSLLVSQLQRVCENRETSECCRGYCGNRRGRFYGAINRDAFRCTHHDQKNRSRVRFNGNRH